MGKHPDVPTIRYRHKATGEEQVVYEGTGAHDAFRTDPDYERVSGSDPADQVAPKTSKVGANDDVSDLSTPELRQLAAQAGHPDPFSLEREEALEIAERRAEKVASGVMTDSADEQKREGARETGSDGDGDSRDAEVSEDLKREALEDAARDQGIADPDDREKFPNKGSLVDAIEEAQKGS